MTDVSFAVASLDLRFDVLDERVEMIREGTVSAIGFAANASCARFEKLVGKENAP